MLQSLVIVSILEGPKAMSNSTTWVLVANASRACLYESHGRVDGLKLIREFTHPSSRAKGADLTSDRPGHSASGRGGRKTSLEPHADARRQEQERFAREIVQELEAAHASHRYDKLLLTASAPFLGLLKAQLPKGVARTVTHSQNKDFTSASAVELASELGEHLHTLGT